MALRQGSRRLFNWLKGQQAGEIVAYEDIMAVTGWSDVSLKTYLNKNKIAPFLEKLTGHRLKVLLDGREINEQFFDETFTQTAPRPVALSAGSTLHGGRGSYELLQPLGDGAVGKVWSARGTYDRSLVATKVMLPREDLLRRSGLPDVRERFRREAKYGRSLEHDNLVRYLDTGEINKNAFLVMELADRSVWDKIAQFGGIAEDQAAEIVGACVRGLRYLHCRGHAHRDVKPANILQCGANYKLGDLGIVRWSDFDPAITKGGTITRHSMQLGSWYYMAPEQQVSPHDVGLACDIYALGITWIEMLTAEVPPPHAIGANKYRLPVLRGDLGEIVRRMCAYDPKDRPTLNDVESALRAAYGD